jgi:toxin ParE1/3/4
VSERFSVVWAEIAVCDLEEIISYIAVDSPGNAERILQRLRSKAESLSLFPHRGRVVPELRGLGLAAWRELLIRPYRLIYRISDSRVYVLGVLDGRRELEEILFDRLLRHS